MNGYFAPPPPGVCTSLHCSASGQALCGPERLTCVCLCVHHVARGPGAPTCPQVSELERLYDSMKLDMEALIMQVWVCGCTTWRPSSWFMFFDLAAVHSTSFVAKEQLTCRPPALIWMHWELACWRLRGGHRSKLPLCR